MNNTTIVNNNTALILVTKPPQGSIIEDLMLFLKYYYEEFMIYFLNDDVARVMSFVIMCLCFGILANLALHSIMYYLMHNRVTHRPDYRKRVLFVTAHPGDEALYFGPTIMRLRNVCDVFLLCFTNGNYKGVGRKSQLWASCATLGIPISNITMLNNQHFPDNPTIYWNCRRVFEILIHHIQCLRIEEVYTFDIDGVNGDRNHASIFYGFAYMLLNQDAVPGYCTVYLLDTVNLLRRFACYLDVPITFVLPHDMLYMIEFGEANDIREAMSINEPHLPWCSQLYISFSRYIYSNSYRILEEDDVNLVLQMADYNPIF